MKESKEVLFAKLIQLFEIGVESGFLVDVSTHDREILCRVAAEKIAKTDYAKFVDEHPDFPLSENDTYLMIFTLTLRHYTHGLQYKSANGVFVDGC